MQPEPFTLAVADAAIADLRQRLANTRFPDQAPDEPWAYGTDLDYMRGLVAYLARPFRLAGARGSSERLATVQGDAGRDRPAFSARPGRGSQSDAAAAVAWLARLGVRVSRPDPPPDRSGTVRRRSGRCIHRGGAVAAGLRPVLRAGPEALLAAGDRRLLRQPDDRRSRLPALCGARRRLGLLRHLLSGRGACGSDRRHPSESAAGPPRSRHARQPHAGGAALPRGTGALAQGGDRLSVDPGYAAADLGLWADRFATGLAAWIVEKFRAWSDCGGDVESVFSKDEMLANISLYWFTGAIGSSFWPYYARLHGPWPVPDGSIGVPTGYCAFPREILRPPRSVAERVYTDIRRWSVMPRGGHFAAMEQPDALAEELRAFVRPLR